MEKRCLFLITLFVFICLIILQSFAEDVIWITHRNANNVSKLTPDGTTVGTFAVGKDPVGIAVDGSGNVWVVNRYDDNVTKLNPDGTTRGTFDVGEDPNRIAVDGFGNVWVANYSSSNITKIRTDGTTAVPFAVGGGPTGIAVDGSGNVWVTKGWDDNITKLNPDGTTVGTFDVGLGPEGIAVDGSGNVWVVNRYDGTVTKLNPDGGLLGSFVMSLGYKPTDIAVDSSGNVWVPRLIREVSPYSLQAVVTKLKPDGTTAGVFEIGRDWKRSDPEPYPGGIAIDTLLTLDTTAPVVNAGNDVGGRNATFTQNGVAQDANGIASIAWSKVLGPGGIKFGTPDKLTTTVGAEVDGEYTIRLTVMDNAGNTNTDEMTFTWDTTAPTVSAGADAGEQNTVFTQIGTATDANGITSTVWSKVLGQGQVFFGEPNRLRTTVKADIDGAYTIRLTVMDNAGNTNWDDLTFTWDATSPQVEAGADAGVKSAAFTQSGNSRGNGSMVSTAWSKASGPGQVTFENPKQFSHNRLC